MSWPPLQNLVVYAVVAVCALYSLWIFLPAALKRRLAAALMARSQRLAGWRFLQRAAQPAGGCGSGCGSCDSPAPPAREHRVQLFRRK
ncbi:MAG: hypothetical protein EOO54_02555 [Haliea sp.]|nr:MAG: hypothetical protein EOO54_02555 [Haliea sp.]